MLNLKFKSWMDSTFADSNSNSANLIGSITNFLITNKFECIIWNLNIVWTLIQYLNFILQIPVVFPASNLDRCKITRCEWGRRLRLPASLSILEVTRFENILKHFILKSQALVDLQIYTTYIWFLIEVNWYKIYVCQHRWESWRLQGLKT